jgi:hypothetical protein
MVDHPQLAKIWLAFLTMLFFLFNSPFALGDSKISVVKITVRAKGLGDPLSRVEMKLEGQKYYTDPKGELSITLPEKGTLECYRRGFEVLTIPIPELKKQIQSDSSGKQEIELYLFPATPQSDEIVVTGVRRPEVSRKKITVEEAIKVAPNRDPAQIPKLLPGVQTSSFRPEVVIRGSGPTESKYMVDDWSVPYIFHSVGNISIISPQLLQDVEFSSGGFGPQYGDATGGVISLKTKNGLPEREQTEFQINVPLYSGIFHERRVNDGKAKLALGARRSYIDKILPKILERRKKETGMDLTVVPYFGDFNIYYEDPDDQSGFKILALHSYDGLRLAVPSTQSESESGQGRFSIRDSVSLIGFQMTRNLGDNWSLSTAPYISDVDRKIDILSNRIYVGATSLALQAEATKRLKGRQKFYLGSEIIHYWGRADVFVPRPDFNDPFFDFEEAPKIAAKVKNSIDEVGVWTAYDTDLGPLFLSPGIRLNYSTRINRGQPDPRINGRYALDEDHQLKFAVGQYSKVPEFAEVSEEFGNPKLKFYKSHHYILGIESQWRPSWVTDFQVFYKETKDLVRSDPVLNYANKGQRLSWGAEAFIRRNLTARFFGWLAYTYSQNRERNNPQENYRNSQYDQTHILNLAGNYKINALWETGGRATYHSGDTYTPVDGAVYNANLDKYQQRNNSTTKLYSKRLPNYQQFDLYAQREFLFDTWKLGFRFGIEALALKPNAINVQYNYDYSKEEYFTGIPPIPYLELRGVL